jgi:hypothetical protein
VTLKEQVFEYIQKYGPQTNADLVKKFKVKAASLRRTCGELAQAGKIAPMPSKEARLWGISVDARAKPPEDAATGPRSTRRAPPVSEKYVGRPSPTPVEKREDKPVDVKDWRMTDFTF